MAENIRLEVVTPEAEDLADLTAVDDLLGGDQVLLGGEGELEGLEFAFGLLDVGVVAFEAVLADEVEEGEGTHGVPAAQLHGLVHVRHRAQHSAVGRVGGDHDRRNHN